MTHARRDIETAAIIEKVWRNVRYIGNLVSNWREPETEAALVVGDALIEQGFSTAGGDLSRFANRMQKWKTRVPYWSWEREKSKEDPPPPKWERWKDIAERVDAAIKQIAQKTAITREWHQRRPHQAMVVLERRWPHEGSNRIEGPYPITPRDIEDITTIRKWWTKQGYRALGKVQNFWIEGAYQPFTRVGSAIVIYPNSGLWRKITIEPGQTRGRARGREIQEIARLLEQSGFSRPNQYARMLFRGGATEQHLISILRSEGADAVARRYGFRRTARDRERAILAAWSR